MIRVKDVMSAHPVMVSPTQTVQEAARLMKENECGVLPVGDTQCVIGVLTDRDIAVRVAAEGKDVAKIRVQEVMTPKFIVCNENDPLEHAADLMRKHDVSRIMVADEGLLVGIVTIADLLYNKGDRRESDLILHRLLGRKTPQKKQASMAGAAGGCESCDS